MAGKNITVEQLKEIAREANKKERLLKDICAEYGITDKTFQNKYKKTEIIYDRSNKLYIIPGEQINGQIDLLEDNTKVKPVSEVAITTTIEQPVQEVEVTKQIEEQEQPKKIGRPKKNPEERIEELRKTFIITPQIEKALRLKAINEGIGLNELVRELLEQSIEHKYFEGL